MIHATSRSLEKPPKAVGEGMGVAVNVTLAVGVRVGEDVGTGVVLAGRVVVAGREGVRVKVTEGGGKVPAAGEVFWGLQAVMREIPRNVLTVNIPKLAILLVTL